MQIDIQQLSMTYPSGKQALKGLNLALKSPSLIGLLGPNGAGKSTLMKLLVAALEPTGGTILVNGQPLRKNERMLKEQLGYSNVIRRYFPTLHQRRRGRQGSHRHRQDLLQQVWRQRLS